MKNDLSGSGLRDFLCEHRGAIDPKQVGLPARKRGKGLRREDVAELLGVSPLWYGLFESGGSGRKFSADFMNGIASVLALNTDERAMMVRLAIAQGVASPEVQSFVETSRSREALAYIAEYARSIRNASVRADALAVAQNTLEAFLQPISSWVSVAMHGDEGHIGFDDVVRAIAQSFSQLDTPSIVDLKLENARSAMIIPVRFDGRNVALFCVHSDVKKAYGSLDLAFATVVANEFVLQCYKSDLIA